jgi:hypothetical protein
MAKPRVMGLVGLGAGVVTIVIAAVAGGVGGALARSWADVPPPVPQVISSEAAKVAAPEQPGAVVAALTPLLQYQGRLTSPSTGQPVADGVFAMSFRLYDVANGGTALWTETKNVQVAGGLFSTALGDTAPLTQSLFNGQALWLGVTVGADLEAIPRQTILPVAYALSLVPGAVISTASNSPAVRGYSAGNTAYFSSTTTFGVRGDTASASAGQAGVVGNAGADPGVTPSQESGVIGKAANGNGVSGVSGNQAGVYGVSNSGYGVRAESLGSGAGLYALNAGTGYGGYFYSYGSYGGYFYGANGRAIYAGGDITATGNIKSYGDVRGQYTALPIAYGHINSNGTEASSSSNVSSIWNASHYEITLTGETYYYTSYASMVTLGYGCGAGNTARVTSGGGKLWVFVLTSAGSTVQCEFQFVTYKP